MLLGFAEAPLLESQFLLTSTSCAGEAGHLEVAHCNFLALFLAIRQLEVGTTAQGNTLLPTAWESMPILCPEH